ncbi:MAG: hypothetical protein IJ623_04170 [Bacteroidales bacterium]|nr:hypothetical protein [Bacteroidales bacterium]
MAENTVRDASLILADMTLMGKMVIALHAFFLKMDFLGMFMDDRRDKCRQEYRQQDN